MFCRCEDGPLEDHDPVYDTLRCLTCGHDVRLVRISPSTRRLALAIASSLMDSGSRLGAARNPARVVSPPRESGLRQRERSFSDHA